MVLFSPPPSLLISPPSCLPLAQTQLSARQVPQVRADSGQCLHRVRCSSVWTGVWEGVGVSGACENRISPRALPGARPVRLTVIRLHSPRLHYSKEEKTHRGAFCGGTPYQMTTIAAASRPGCRSVGVVFELRS